MAFTEPLIYPHLMEAAQIARARGLQTSVTTNGLQLDKKAAALAEAGVDYATAIRWLVDDALRRAPVPQE